MKTIGLIGGMSWESSAVYYKLINQMVNKRLGGYHSAKCVMVSVDFAGIEELQHKNDWKSQDEIMVNAAKQLESAGADLIILCTNTMHLCAPAIVQNISIPFLHIAETTGLKIVGSGLKKVALLGTRFTMEKDFYKNYILERFGIQVIVPSTHEINIIHNVIYKELVHGIILHESREKFKQIIGNLQLHGVQGIILGCTEIPLLISETDVKIPLFDTTKIHAEKAVEWALQ